MGFLHLLAGGRAFCRVSQNMRKVSIPLAGNIELSGEVILIAPRPAQANLRRMAAKHPVLAVALLGNERGGVVIACFACRPPSRSGVVNIDM